MESWEWVLVSISWVMSAVVIGLRQWFSWRVRVHTRRYEALKRQLETMQ